MFNKKEKIFIKNMAEDFIASYSVKGRIIVKQLGEDAEDILNEINICQGLIKKIEGDSSMNKRLRKVIIPMVLTMTMSIGSNYIGSYKASAASTLPPTSVSQSELNKDNSMTLEQLKAIAKPLPEDAIRTETDKFGTSNELKFDSLLPEDANIYYTESIANDGTRYLNFYKFLYVSTAEQNTITYHEYVWYFINGVKDRAGKTQANEGNETLYKELFNAENNNAIPSEGGSSTPSSDNSNSSSNGSNSNSNGNISSKTYTQKRLGGADRIETSKLIAEEYNNSTVQNVVVTNGYSFADALSGSVLANKLQAPILLTGSDITDSSATIDYIKNHLDKNGTIYILGGEGAVNSEFVSKFKEMGFTNIKRLSGNTRYDTNNVINSELGASKGTPIVIANGENFADALSISSIASNKGYPIVLSSSQDLLSQVEKEINNIKPSQVYIVGGTGAVSDNVKNKIQSISGLSDDKVTRISGNTRYETSLAIAKYFNLDSSNVVIASGENYPDALSGSVLAAKDNAPIILVNNDAKIQKGYLDTTKYTNEILLGGIGSITNDVESSLK